MKRLLSALVVFCTNEKLRRAIFRKVVKQPLKAYTRAEAVADNGVAVACYRFEMLYRLHYIPFLSKYSKNAFEAVSISR